MAEPKTSAMIAKCRADVSCGYAWIIAFLPMDMALVGKMASRCTCPMCGDRSPTLGQPGNLDPTLRAHLDATLAEAVSHA